MNMNYECHVTVAVRHAAIAQQVATELHWKTSEIKRDPILGDDSFYYLTTHADDVEKMFQRMRDCVEILGLHEVPVLREKIELIIYDTKAKKAAGS